MTKSTDKRPNDAFAYLLSDNSDRASLLKIAALSDFQIGLPENPAELHVTGRSSYSCSFVEVQPGKIINYPNDVTVLLVSTIPYEILKTGIYQNKTLKSGQAVTVIMPQDARVGQICYIKDVSGTADSCNIILQLTKLANEQTKIIDYKDGCIGLVWTGISWSAITGGGQDFPLAENDISKSIQDAINDYGVASLDESYVVLSSNSSLPNKRVLTAGTGITITDGGAGSNVTIAATGGGSGDVVGPGSSTDNAIARFDGLLGKTIQNSSVTIDDSNNVSVPGRITVTGGTTTYTDAVLGNAAVGSFPYYDGTLPSSFALFGHKDLNHAYSAVSDAGSRNYALVQDSSGNTYVNASTSQTLYLSVNNTAMGAFTNSLLGTGISSILLTGDLTTRTNVRLGNTTGASITQIYAGTAGISISGSATTTITGSSSSQTELIVGNVEIGEFPYTRATFPNYFAMFGHTTLDHSVNGNYALVQSYSGDTFLNSPTTIYFQNAGNLIGYLDNNNVSLTGQSSTSVTTEIGSSYGLSSTTIKGGSFGLTISGSSTSTTITGSASTSAEAIIGMAEVGELPATRTSFPNYFAMFGHKTLDHSTNGNYAVLQSYNGDSFLNSPTTIYLQNAGNLIGYLDNDNISLTGQASTSVTTELGSVYGLSSTTIKGGAFGFILTGSGTTITITGSTASQADAYIGSSEVGTHPYWGRNYAMFSHKDMNNSVDGNSALIQSNTGDTFLGAASGQNLYFKNGTTILGNISSFFTTFSGSAFGTLTSNVTSINGNNSLSLYGGSGGIQLSSSAGYTTITGSTSTTTEVIIGMAAVGELPATRTTFPNYFTVFGHKNLDQSKLWNYAVVQNGAPNNVAGSGDTFINSPSTIYFQFSGSSGGTVGTLDNNTVSFTGLAGTATTTTIGNTASTSATTINAGSGDILISASLGDVILGTPNIRNTGRVGIGTSTPSYKLEVQTDAAASWAAAFFNDGNATNRYGIRIQSGTDTTTGDLIDFYDGDGTIQGTISFNAGTVTYGAFTGDHYARINDIYTEKVYGTIVKVVSTNSEPGRKNINYVVEKTTSAKDPAVFGVYAASLDASPDESLRDCHSIFSLGDGHILVTDEGGNIEIGDYICSSNIPGHGMKQDDDLLHSYTVAKATQTVDFSTEQIGPNGYRSILITCTYHAS